MKRDIVQVGEPVLRQRARDLAVEEIRSRAIQELIAVMKENARMQPFVCCAIASDGRCSAGDRAVMLNQREWISWLGRWCGRWSEPIAWPPGRQRTRRRL